LPLDAIMRFPQILPFLLFPFLLLAGCAKEPAIYKTQGYVFGTLVEVSIYGEPDAIAQKQAGQVLAEFDRLHRKFHAWQPGALTELNQHIAQGEPYQADPEMVALLKSAAVLSTQSDGLFNPAIGHLIRLWGFQSDTFTPHLPDPRQVARLVAAHPQMSDLDFNGNTVTSRNRAVMLDLGGYAKGYALDRAAAILRAGHVQAALINIGGNVLAIGQPGHRPWHVGIRDPRGAGAMATVDLHDGEAIGTSGDYQRYFLLNGHRYCHIIDPRSGYPVSNVEAVTLITSGKDAGLLSDGNSKPLFISGPGQWRSMASRLGLGQAVLVDTSGKVEMTAAMKDRLALTPKLQR
jgi:FAD:protein FMN transferase